MTVSRCSLSLAVPQVKMLWVKGINIYIIIQRITHSNHSIRNMPLSSDKKIEKLKDLAIWRCRERIERAACKAKELMNTQIPERQDEKYRYGNQPPGMTSFLKRRHGL
jgi:hypothetical protein